MSLLSHLSEQTGLAPDKFRRIETRSKAFLDRLVRRDYLYSVRTSKEPEQPRDMTAPNYDGARQSATRRRWAGQPKSGQPTRTRPTKRARPGPGPARERL
jgi:hypothetical protein